MDNIEKLCNLYISIYTKMLLTNKHEKLVIYLYIYIYIYIY